MLFYASWGAAALHPSVRRMTVPATARERGWPWPGLRLVVMAGSSLLVPLALTLRTTGTVGASTPVVAVAAAAVFLLVVARVSRLFQALSTALAGQEQAVGRERALRQAGAELAAAQSREQICAVALRAAAVLAGEGHTRVDLALGDTDQLTVDCTPDPDDPAGGPEPGAVLRVPFDTTPRGQGMMTVHSASPLTQESADGITALASTVALALERFVLAEERYERRSEERFRSLVQNASELMTVVEGNRHIRYQSPSVTPVLGYDPDRLCGTDILDLVHPDDRPGAMAHLADLAERPAGMTAVLECRLRHHDGTWRHVEMVGNNLSGDPNVGGIVLTTRDVSERRALEDQLRHQAFHDSLTGLANRALFANRVEHALIRSHRHAQPMAVLFIDLDDFKTVNDTLGHVEGDEMLAAVADRLRGCLREGDTAARLGGDEFGVLLEELATPGDARAVGEKILEAMRPPFLLQGVEMALGASIGISVAEGGAAGADVLLRDADVAMYMAKSEGKGRCVTFEPEMQRRLVQRLELKAELQRTIDDEDGLCLRYHPIVDLGTGTVVGMEALVRWDHPERGLVSPAEFIPLAEETGLIVPLGRWVLREAARQGALWQARYPSWPPLRLTVNLSGRQLQHPGLVLEVARALEDSGLRPGSLVLEITESILLQDDDVTTGLLEQLRRLGARLAVDDFGTGYSSLSYLRQMPVDILKIDKSFVDHVDAGGEGEALTRAIVDLAAGLGLETIAEGIERPEQITALASLGCRLGQGFHFAKPLPVDEMDDYLAANTHQASAAAR
jgi:diguanylate cyclase (GGDEF)-like protein/PAS domain S-box-containing protein